MKEGDMMDLTGGDGRVCDTVKVLRVVTLRGIPGFAVHAYKGEYRVSHIETGAYLCRGATDGEAFVTARRFDSEELNQKIVKTAQELVRLRSLRKEEK